MRTEPVPSCVTVVTVSFNSLAVLPVMLASLPNGVRTILVDNASADTAALQALADGHGAHLILNHENQGFGFACNQGAALATTEFLLFLNPDAALQPGAIDALLAAMDRFPQASAMNPRILEADGSPHFKRRSPLMPRGEWMDRNAPDADCEVTVLTGAALFVRRAAFEQVGGFDEAIFLYHEDDDLSRRLRAKVGPLMNIPQAVVRHLSGHSSPRSPEVAALKAWHMGRSLVYATRQHGRPSPFASALLLASLQMLSPAILLSRRKRAKQLAFLRGVWSARAAGTLPIARKP